MKVNELIEELKKFKSNSPVWIPNSKMDGGFGRIEKVEGHDDGSIRGGEGVSLYPYGWRNK